MAASFKVLYQKLLSYWNYFQISKFIDSEKNKCFSDPTEDFEEVKEKNAPKRLHLDTKYLNFQLTSLNSHHLLWKNLYLDFLWKEDFTDIFHVTKSHYSFHKLYSSRECKKLSEKTLKLVNEGWRKDDKRW